MTAMLEIDEKVKKTSLKNMRSLGGFLMSSRQMQSSKRAEIAKEFIKASSIVYVIMAVVGFEICWWYHQNVKALLGPINHEAGVTFGIIAAAVFFLCICQRYMEMQFPSYRRFKMSLASIFSGVSLFGAVWLALLSSVAEELLFRGALQPFLGIWVTSALFGLLHLDAEGGVCAWTVWAVLAGVILGAVVSVTGSLWPAIVIHFVVNFIGIRGLSKIDLKPQLMRDPSIR